MKRLLLFISAALIAFTFVLSPARSQENGETPPDKRLGKQKTLNDYFPFTPPKNLKQWKARRAFVKAQVKVANGLWPMPKKTPLKAVIHGKIKRDDYTIEKVYFQSYPGFYVTGNLYRPTNIKKGQKVPGVLCPHGHWGGRNDPAHNGRFYEASDKSIEAQLKNGAERTREGAKYPLQARCAQLARMGCVVFHYDMIGYGDSTQIYHPLSRQNPKGRFTDAEAALWQQNQMGVQTWDSIRSLDFLLSLPEVDNKRIGVTGASGGGTQTFILAAVDGRVKVAFPAVMVSTSMQGGCVCENCTYLRLNSGNIELAGLFAPRPLAMSGANDWTKEIETKGLPQLKQLYKLYGKAGNVAGKAFVQFGHNYNNVSREYMYNWFNKHLKLGQKTPVVERPFVPVPPAELSVWDEKHPRPKANDAARMLREYMTKESKRQLKGMFPKDVKRLKRLHKIAGTALRVIMSEQMMPKASDVSVKLEKGKASKNRKQIHGYLGRKGMGEAVPITWTKGKKFNGTVVVAVYAKKEAGSDDAKNIIAKGGQMLAVYPFGVGLPREKLPPVDKRYHGYTWGYNRTILANRVHDILTAVAYAKGRKGVKKVHLIGIGEAGPWVVMARALCGDTVERTAADLNQFRFEEILSMSDSMMQPGALRYGGLPAFTALCAPNELFIYNAHRVDPDGWISAAYRAAGQQDKLRQRLEPAETEDVVSWLLR